MKKKSNAFTLVEMLVSGTIMVAVTVLSFDVMATGARLSAAGVQASSKEADTRTDIEILQKDILEADRIKTQINDSGLMKAKAKQTLILRKPVFNAAGNVVVGKYLYVVYTREGSGKGAFVMRLTGIQTGNSPFSLTKDRMMFKDIKAMRFATLKTSTIQPNLGEYNLPGTMTSDYPKGSKIRLRGATIPEAGVRLVYDTAGSSAATIKTALSPLNSQINTTGSVVGLKLGPATKAADFIYETDPTYSVNTDNDALASRVIVAIVTDGRKGQPDSRMTAGGNLRNAQ